VSAGRAAATTQPGVLYTSTLIISDARIVVADNKFATRTGYARYPRGSMIRYTVVNRGSRAFSLDILGSATGAVQPGRRKLILVNWDRRGSFVFRAAPRGPRLRVRVV
jgi:hypothetical protein